MTIAPHPHRTALRIILAVTAASIAAALVGIVLQSRGADSAWIFFTPVPIAILGFVLYPMLWFSGRRVQRQIQKLRDGDYLAHWRYSEAEWLEFARADWARTRRTARRMLPEITGLIMLAALLLALVAEDISLKAGLGAGALFGLGFAALAAALTYHQGRSTYRGRLAAPGEIYIGRKAVYQDGVLRSWGGLGMSLDSVSLETASDSQPQLCFQIRGPKGSSRELRVLVPRDKLDEASTLLTSLGAEGLAEGPESRMTGRPGRRRGRGGGTVTAAAPAMTGTVAAAKPADAAAAAELQLWLDSVMQRFQPEKLRFAEGQTLRDLFQLIIMEEELKVRRAGGDPFQSAKLEALAALRQQFS